MASNTTTGRTLASDARTATDGLGGVDQLLEDLSSLNIARRIQDAARLAVTKHVRCNARLMPSAVEAENSTELA